MAFSPRDAFELIAGSGIPAERVKVSGGGAASPLWRQILADVFGRRVSTSDFSEDASALGAGILAGLQAGFWSSVGEAAGMLREKTVAEPDPQRVAAYGRLFEVYRGLYSRLREVFEATAPFQRPAKMGDG